jgi:hypothetical protein
MDLQYVAMSVVIVIVEIALFAVVLAKLQID